MDVGIRHLVALSTGQTITNPRALEGSLRKLRRLNRQLARRTPRSRRRNGTRRRLARVHARAANLRCDALHKLTTSLATQHGNVVVEQLNVAGMLRNRRLARVLSDTGMAELRRQLGYKAIWYGCRLVESVAQSGWETQTARGADQKPQPAGQVAMKREAGTEPGSG